jgi:hypothetical protein
MFEIYPSVLIPTIAVVGAVIAITGLTIAGEHTAKSAAIICAILLMSVVWFIYLYRRSREGLHNVVLRTDGLEWEGRPATARGCGPR